MPTAIITGATRGIGKAIALRLLNEGFDLAVCARDRAALDALKIQWAKDFNGSTILTAAFDITDTQALRSFVNQITDTFPRVDMLVNNAGMFMSGNIMDEPEGQLEQMLRVNLMSAYHLSRAVIPVMRRQQYGHIFNICSIAGLKAYPGGGAYSISKYALLGMTENLRYELRPFHIKVTAISPGAVWTDSWSNSGVEESRIMKAEDVADTLWAAFRLSPQANVEHIIMRPQQGDL